MRARRLKSTEEKVGLKRSAIYEGMAEGWFPKCFKLIPGGKAVAWDDDELDAFLAKRKAERDGKAA